MNYDISYFSLLLFFIPGLLFTKVDLFYGADRRASYLNQFYNVIISGSISYGFVGFVYWITPLEFSIPFDVLLGFPSYTSEMSKNYFWFEFAVNESNYHWFPIIEPATREVVRLYDCIDEVFWAIVVSYIFGLIWLKAVRKKTLMNLLQKFKFTDQFSGYDVWTEYVNTGDIYDIHSKIKLRKLRKIRIWNDDEKRVYCGKTSTLAMSDYDDIREIILVDVKIYRFDKNLNLHGPLMKQSLIYLSFSKNNNVWIEFRGYKGESNKDK